jgi:hypothetical protein
VNDLLARLIAAGTPAELVAEVAMELGRAQGELASLERRRAADRDRQAKRRHVTSRDVTDAEPAKEIPPNPHKKISPPVSPDGLTAPRGRADRGSRIEDDWQPPVIAVLPPEAQSLAKQWPAAAYRAEAEAFRNFWQGESGARARKSNWNKAWYNRIVQVHPQVMRTAKFAPVVVSSRVNPDKPMTAEGHLRLAQYHDDRSDPRKADYHREEARRLSSAVPFRQLIQNVHVVEARH